MARFLVPSSAAAVLALLPLHASMTDGAASVDPPCPSPEAAAPSASRLDLFASLNQLLAATAAPTETCPRPAAGSVVQQPTDLWSKNGVLQVEFGYYTTTDSDGRTLYCFQTPDGVESPTLHIKPGDTLDLTLQNQLPPPAGFSNWPTIATVEAICGAAQENPTSVNLHYHGTNTSPACHADNVVHTLVNSGQTFRYRVKFPKNEPPGLYWYHPHVHPMAQEAVQGGATGAIVIDGIENLQPAVSGLPERILLVRDQSLADKTPPRGHEVPSEDVSLNYVPIPYPAYTPAVIQMPPGDKEFWRLANVSADTTVDIELNYDGTPQPLEIVALDGVPIGSQDGLRRGRTITVDHFLVPPASRVEFIMTGPSASVQNAVLLTKRVRSGPPGFDNPKRPLATIVPTQSAARLPVMPYPSGPPNPQRFEGLDAARVTAHRRLYFSEREKPGDFYITVDGAQPTLFSATNPPSIVTTQGSVEEWTIENRTREIHAFHIHQIHFKLLEQDGIPAPPIDAQFRDTVNIPPWPGTGPYPRVTLRMDFRGIDVGDFVYHCHILAHEDMGMMAIIRVLPRS
jgi:FtsP/CotA-like multicopper oxidase with cupredoxin domain